MAAHDPKHQTRTRADSQTRLRASEVPSGPLSQESAERSLENLREGASSMRSQGWRWELAGRALAYEDSARQVRKWLLERGDPDRATIEFVVDLLERSAEVHRQGDLDDEPET